MHAEFLQTQHSSGRGESDCHHPHILRRKAETESVNSDRSTDSTQTITPSWYTDAAVAEAFNECHSATQLVSHENVYAVNALQTAFATHKPGCNLASPELEKLRGLIKKL